MADSTKSHIDQKKKKYEGIWPPCDLRVPGPKPPCGNCKKDRICEKIRRTKYGKVLYILLPRRSNPNVKIFT